MPASSTGRATEAVPASGSWLASRRRFERAGARDHPSTSHAGPVRRHPRERRYQAADVGRLGHVHLESRLGGAAAILITRERGECERRDLASVIGPQGANSTQEAVAVLVG